AWDAFLYHIKPPEAETLEAAIRKTTEKAQMAARFVRKQPSRRIRLATGAYSLNLWRAKVVAPLLPLYAGIASSARVPRGLAAFARAQLLDGVYVERLRRELRSLHADSDRSA
ncbi:MAG: hypothetical protein JO101_04650, partial [Candidatus Eremiobacteraeota bacterium]|nr:hypothetical protein [Candidatus Eremiobacteraeota bacterium]